MRVLVLGDENCNVAVVAADVGNQIGKKVGRYDDL